MSRQDSDTKQPANGYGNLAEIFTKRLTQLGLKKQVDAAMLCEAFNESVFQVFGEAGRKNVKAISFRDKTLKIAVTSSAWAQEISLKQLELKKDQKIRFVFKTIDIDKVKENL